MGPVLTLVLKDLRRAMADPAGILMSLAIPLAIAGTMALAFGGLSGGDGPSVPKMELVIVDLDEGPLSNFISGASQNDQAAEYLVAVRAESPEEGVELMKDAGHHAVLVIPKGFTEMVLDGRETRLELIKNPARSVMPIVAQQGLEVVGLYGSVGAKMLPEGAADRIEGLIEGEGWDDAIGITALITDTYIRVKRSESLLLPPVIKVSKVKEGAPEEEVDQAGGFDAISWMYPGMVVMAILFVGLNGMKDLLAEQDSGTLRRMLSGPVSVTQFLVGKVLSSAVTVAGALLILLLIGTLFFGMSWGSLLPLSVVFVAVVLATTGFSALLYSFVRTQNQGDAIGGIFVIVMSLLGGTMVPAQVLPEFVQTATRFTLNYWCNEALRTIASGGGWDQLMTHLPVLMTMAVVFTALGTILLKMRHLRGAV